MSTGRPTHLRLASRHCPRAVDYAEAGIRTDRTPFESGIAAHEVLAALGEATERAGAPLDRASRERVARATFGRLVHRGRMAPGSDRREPPLGADRVAEGRDLALRYVDRFPLTPGGGYELRLAARRDGAAWLPVRRRSRKPPYYRAILDRLAVTVEDGQQVLHLRDYKSAWSTGEEELDTVQVRSQTVLAALYHPEAARITREVVNLRTLHPFAHTITLDAEGRALLDRWRRDVDAQLDALADQAAAGARPASPGAGCYGCPYFARCEPAWEALLAQNTPENRARAFAVGAAWLDSLKAKLKGETDHDLIRIDAEHVVGTLGKAQRALDPAAAARLADAWGSANGATDLAGLIATAELGVGQAEKLAKALYPQRREKPDRDAFLAQLTASVIVRSFGVHELPMQEQELAE